MNVLNLYAGIGGNRKLWEGVEVTAVEYNEEIAAIYKKHFPQDNVIVGDAHEYLLNHYKEFDFIWSSRPCQTHSRSRFWSSKGGMYSAKYPDMGLYEEIIFLQHFFEGKWIVENVIPYYEPLIKPTMQLERHFIWCNFPIKYFEIDKIKRDHNSITGNTELYGYNLKGSNIKNKTQVLRNMVDPQIGLYIFELATGIIRKAKEEKQQSIF